jgi:O-antigen ligase
LPLRDASFRGPHRGSAAPLVGSLAAGLLTTFAGVFPLISGLTPSDPDNAVLPKLVCLLLVVGVLLGLWIARSVAQKGIYWRSTPVAFPAVAVVAASLVTSLSSVDPKTSVLGEPTRYGGFITALAYALLTVLTTQLVRTRDTIRWILRAMIVGALVECCIAWTQVAAGVGGLAQLSTDTAYAGVPRAVGTMANANNLAIYLGMVTCLVAYEWRSAAVRSTRLSWAGIECVVVATLLATYGRAAWLGTAVGLLTLLWRTRAEHTRAHMKRLILLTVATGVSLVLVLFSASWLRAPGISTISSRIASIADPNAGAAYRAQIYRVAIGAALQRPLVGFGPETFARTYAQQSGSGGQSAPALDEAHSDLLQLAVTQGLFGVAAEVWLVFAALRQLSRREAGGILAALVAYFVAIEFNFAWLPVTTFFWLVIACGSGTFW